MPKRKIKLWLDDRRPAPDGWVWVRHVWEAVVWLKRDEVAELELDYDLGPDDKPGFDLVVWMARHGRWPDTLPIVHSQNRAAADGMRFVIARWYGRRAG